MNTKKILEKIYNCRKLYQLTGVAALELEELGSKEAETRELLIGDGEFSAEILIDEVRWHCREVEVELIKEITPTEPTATKEEMFERYVALTNIISEAGGDHDEEGRMPDWFSRFVSNVFDEQRNLIEISGYMDNDFFELEEDFTKIHRGRELPHRFYAKYAELNDAVAVFDTEEERDKWVMYKDEFSIDTETTPENAFFQRSALTLEEARRLSCDRIYCEERFVEDDALDNLKWVVVPSYRGRKQY